jgi:arylsulfatase A-like enzyme
VDNGTEYLTDKLTDYGVEFIEKNGNKPFFLYLAYSAPHVVIVPRPDKLMKYFMNYNRSEEKFNPYYSAMVESIDEGVGKIVETLREKGVINNTIIIFTSDNGGLGLDELGPTPTSLLPLRKWKGHVYEGGIRVPAIVSWPGFIAPGSVSDEYFSTVDYLPTISAIAGINEIPEGVDGVNITSLFWSLGRSTIVKDLSSGIIRTFPISLAGRQELSGPVISSWLNYMNQGGWNYMT